MKKKLTVGKATQDAAKASGRELIFVDWTKGNVVRQGDVAIINNAPRTTENYKPAARDKGGVVLAYGEVTGHSHQFRDRNVCMLVAEGVTDRVVTIGDVSALLGNAIAKAKAERDAASPAVLRHEEHDWMVLPPGKHTTRIQVEWEGESARNVED